MKSFYQKCAEILNVDYNSEPFPYRYRTRWNNRQAGEGRFEGYGIIRKFGSKIHVALRNPLTHIKVYDTEEEVLKYLRQVKTN